MASYVADRIYLDKQAVTPYLDDLVDRCTYDNPAYWDARKYRRPCKHIPRAIELLEETDDHVVLPRGMLSTLAEILPEELVDSLDDRRVLPPLATPLELAGTLRPYQSLAVATLIARGQGVLQAPTGSGKTVMAMGLIQTIGTPTLIVVHTTLLLNQTRERIRQFLGVEAGIIGGGQWQVEDITVATVQTLTKRGYGDLTERVGLVILDEAHHCPAVTFKRVVQDFPARFRVGLTATPRRKDRLHPVLFDTIGPVVHVVDSKLLEDQGSVLRAELVEVETSYRYYYRDDYPRMLNGMAKNVARNTVILDAIQEHHRGRSLVVTERVAHAEHITEALVAAGLTAELVVGSVPMDTREATYARFATGETEIIVATSSIVGEGFDQPELDTVFLTMPNGNPSKTKQILGRALRPMEGKATPQIVDFNDARVPILKNQFKMRARIYEG